GEVCGKRAVLDRRVVDAGRGVAAVAGAPLGVTDVARGRSGRVSGSRERRAAREGAVVEAIDHRLAHLPQDDRPELPDVVHLARDGARVARRTGADESVGEIVRARVPPDAGGPG